MIRQMDRGQMYLQPTFVGKMFQGTKTINHNFKLKLILTLKLILIKNIEDVKINFKSLETLFRIQTCNYSSKYIGQEIYHIFQYEYDNDQTNH